jgi:hypothetical protein
MEFLKDLDVYDLLANFKFIFHISHMQIHQKKFSAGPIKTLSEPVNVNTNMCFKYIVLDYNITSLERYSENFKRSRVLFILSVFND